MPVEYVMASFRPHHNQPSVYTHPFRIKNICKIVLTAATIPNARYIIHSSNCYFDFFQSGATIRVDVPKGNRAQTSALLASEIQAAVRNQIASEPGFVCAAGPLGHLQLTAYSGPFSLSFGDSTLYRNMGLNGSAITASIPIGGGEHQITAPNLPARYTTHIYNLRMAVGAVRALHTLEHIIVRRDDAITYFSAQKKERQTSQVYRPPLPFAQQFTFDLLDDSGRRMDLNNLRVTLVIAVHHL